MSPAMSALHSVGITHSMLILAVLALVAAGVIGMFWHIIVPGAIVVLVGTLFINFTPNSTPEPMANKTESVETAKVEKPEFDERQAYMKDCMEVAEYKMYQCVNLWEGRQADEKRIESSNVKEVSAPEHEFRPVSDIKLLDVDNQEYKSKRASAISKPNAVVMQATYR